MEIKSVTGASIIDLQKERDKKEKSKEEEDLKLELSTNLKKYVEKYASKGLRGLFIVTVDSEGMVHATRGFTSDLNKYALIAEMQVCQHMFIHEIIDSEDRISEDI
jgi:hypothetical protein